jgi:autotransporter strand-loop-strand O-heptosyltransferase
MAHKEQKDFCLRVKNKLPHFFKNKRVLDIGSLDINGSNNDLFEDCDYLGIDVGEGKNVDLVSVGHLFDGPDNYYDTIISTEVFEHDMYYEKTIQNIIRMLKPGGLFLFTCAAPGRPEHGTRRLGQDCAPLLLQISEEWADYYKNLTEDDIRKISGFSEVFPDCYFEVNNVHLEIPADLYFYGVKGGEKYITDNIIPVYSKEEFKEHIFIIDAWPNNQSKENDLLSLIKVLKTYNIDILLCTHYPIKSEIQTMVDYYIYDKNNDLLLSEDFEKYQVASGRWTNMGVYTVNNSYEFHHDYAIWETMKNGFNFANYLNKKYIHFLEYDNIPDHQQYKQSFIEQIPNYDVILYEYQENSVKDTHFSPYCATFVFSIRTDVALKVVNQINSKFEYFTNKPKGWQLERVFLSCVGNVTNNIKISEYIANNNELNTQAVWNRDGMNMNGAIFQSYLCVDDQKNLYIHLISGFHEKDAEKDYLVEVEYGDYKKFISIKKKEFLLEKLGRYRKGKHVRVYYQGVMVFDEFLGKTYFDFKKINNVNFRDKKPPTELLVNINFVDGPVVELKGDTDEKFRVEFWDDKGKLYHVDTIRTNMWVKVNKKYFIRWTIKVYTEDNELVYDYTLDYNGNRVYIAIDSKSLGDNIAWIPYVEEFRKKHNCHVVVSTFWNNFFQKEYPMLEFVKPSTVVHNIHGMYTIGCFLDENKEPEKFNILPLQKVPTNILGLDYTEVKTKIDFSPEKNKRSWKKYVAIGYHSTAGLKYWNNPTGWQELTDYLISKGYDVLNLSLDPCGIKGVEELKDKSMNNIMNLLYHSEFFVGISSGLSWLAWGLDKHVVLISNMTNEEHEFQTNVTRIVNKSVCNSCWNDPNHKFDKGDWYWCPLHKGTDRQFECTKKITGQIVINHIEKLIKN